MDPAGTGILRPAELRQFAATLFALSGILRGGLDGTPGGNETLYATVCRVMNVLVTRIVSPVHWRVALDILERTARIWEGRDAAELNYLRVCITTVREHLGIVPGTATSTGSENSDGPDSYLAWVQMIVEFADPIDRVIGAPNPRSAPPASKEEIKNLTSIIVIDDDARCSICLEDITVKCDVLEMPCKHLFHASCVQKWLNTSSSCPLCRHQLKTKIGPAGSTSSTEPVPQSSNTEMANSFADL